MTGAAAIPVELIHRMRRELGFETIITGYGLTECCGIVSMCRYDDPPETIATTSGRAIPDTEVRCVDRSGKEVPRGEPVAYMARAALLLATEPCEKISGRVTYSQEILHEYGELERARGIGAERRGSGYAQI